MAEGFDAGEGPGQLTGLKIEDGDIDSIDIVNGAGVRVARYDLVHTLSAVEEMHLDREETAPSPPSWDPLGLSPHLWGLVDDLPPDPVPDIIGPVEFIGRDIARGFRAIWNPFFITLLCAIIVAVVTAVNFVQGGDPMVSGLLMTLTGTALALLRCAEEDE